MYIRKVNFELKTSFKWYFRFVETLRIPVVEGGVDPAAATEATEEAMVAMVAEAPTATAAANGNAGMDGKCFSGSGMITTGTVDWGNGGAGEPV